MSRESFEKWAKDGFMLQKSFSDTYRSTITNVAWEAWTARQPEIDALKAEVQHWKANHDNMVNRSRVLIERTDIPLERVNAFNQIGELKSEIERLKAEVARLEDHLRDDRLDEYGCARM
jgi:uncharacterized small protein (DUF1192 family)